MWLGNHFLCNFKQNLRCILQQSQIKAQEKLKELNEAYEGLSTFLRQEEVHEPNKEKDYEDDFEEKEYYEHKEQTGPEEPAFSEIRCNFKWVAAFLAFNIYSLFFISAFMENTSYLFDMKRVSNLIESGLIIDPRELGWGGHYIWCLFSSSVVTALAGFLCGAIAKRKGDKVAIISNIPNILIWGFFFYISIFSKIEIEGYKGFAIVSVIAIPLTSVIAYNFGKIGENIQHEEFKEDSVLGIWAYHWIWIVFPLYWYGLGIVFAGTRFASFVFLSPGGFFYTIIYFLFLIPVVVFVYPLIIVYKVLSGNLLSEKRIIIKVLFNTAILISGGLLASSLQVGCYWLIRKII